MGIQIAIRLFMALNKSRQQARQVAERQAQPTSATLEEKPQRKRKIVLVDGIPLQEMIFDPENPTAVEEEEEDDYDKMDGGIAHERRCTLCLGPRRSSTATECGHVCEFSY